MENMRNILKKEKKEKGSRGVRFIFTLKRRFLFLDRPVRTA
jgi:hypothetical protein